MGKDFDIVQLGTSEVDDDTGVPVVQAANRIGEDETDLEQFGDVAMFGALGVTALPAAKTKDGAAEGVILRSCGGSEGMCIAARDSRTNKTVGDLGPGETALHATGDGFDSRIVCREQSIALVIGDPVKVGFQLDNLAKKVQLAAFGHFVEVSEEWGIVLAAHGGKSFISIKGDTIWIKAPKLLLGDKPTVPVSTGISPAVVASPGVLVPAPTP